MRSMKKVDVRISRILPLPAHDSTCISRHRNTPDEGKTYFK